MLSSTIFSIQANYFQPLLASHFATCAKSLPLIIFSNSFLFFALMVAIILLALSRTTP